MKFFAQSSFRVGPPPAPSVMVRRRHRATCFNETDWQASVLTTARFGSSVPLAISATASIIIVQTSKSSFKYYRLLRRQFVTTITAGIRSAACPRIFVSNVLRPAFRAFRPNCSIVGFPRFLHRSSFSATASIIIRLYFQS